MACPKGTKLLVAKAVVKAIEDQKPPGRFLEPDPRPGYSNCWRIATSKKALDKTMQALREKAKTKKEPRTKEHKHKTKAELFEIPDLWPSGTPISSAAFDQVIVSIRSRCA